MKVATPTKNKGGPNNEWMKAVLAHTRWKCQYYVVIVPKYRRKVVYGKLRKDVGEILKTVRLQTCGNNRGACNARPYTYVVVNIADLCISEFMRYLKGKSTLMIFERHVNLKYKYGRRTFWAKGYYIKVQ